MKLKIAYERSAVSGVNAYIALLGELGHPCVTNGKTLEEARRFCVAKALRIVAGMVEKGGRERLGTLEFTEEPPEITLKVVGALNS